MVCERDSRRRFVCSVVNLRKPYINRCPRAPERIRGSHSYQCPLLLSTGFFCHNGIGASFRPAVFCR